MTSTVSPINCNSSDTVPDISLELGMAHDLLAAAASTIAAHDSPTVRAAVRQLINEAGKLLHAAARGYAAPHADRDVQSGMYRLLGLTYVLARELEQPTPTDGGHVLDNPAHDVALIAASLAKELLAKETELFHKRRAA